MTLALGILAAWVLLDLALVGVWIGLRWALSRRGVAHPPLLPRGVQSSAPWGRGVLPEHHAPRRESAWNFPKVPERLR